MVSVAVAGVQGEDGIGLDPAQRGGNRVDHVDQICAHQGVERCRPGHARVREVEQLDPRDAEHRSSPMQLGGPDLTEFGPGPTISVLASLAAGRAGHKCLNADRPGVQQQAAAAESLVVGVSHHDLKPL